MGQSQILVPLEFVIKTGIILLQEGWWLKVSKLATNDIFTNTAVSLLSLTTKYRFLQF